MTRPALAHSNLEPIQAVLPHAEADKTPSQPFFKRCANIRTGSPEHKAVLLAHAAFCEVWTDGLSGRCLASGDTIRALSEVGRRRFWEVRRDLSLRGMLRIERRQAGRTAAVDVMATPDLIRAADPRVDVPVDGEKPSDRRTQQTFEDFLSRYPRGSHLDVTPGGHTKVPSKPERTSDGSVAPVAPAKGSDALPERRTGTDTASGRTDRPRTASLGAAPGAACDPDPDGLGKGEATEAARLALLRAQAEGMATDDERRAAVARVMPETTTEQPTDKARYAAVDAARWAAKAPAASKRCPHCNAKVEGGAACPTCAGSLLSDGHTFEPSADWNGGH